MKQLLVLSGKGGTGKTTVSVALAGLLNPSGLADCDVDAPNLHLSLDRNDEGIPEVYHGMDVARIDPDRCTGCNLCEEHCRFGAISHGNQWRVDTSYCEGCGVCQWICPAEAIGMEPHPAGEMNLYPDPPVFSTARLITGAGNTGLLVTRVKNRLREFLPETKGLTVLDGSPGIGCPVIASVTGTDLVLLVAEPSVSGLSDLQRVLKTTRILRVPAAVVINKADISPEHTEMLEAWCRKEDLPLWGRIPWDPEVVRQVNRGESPAEGSGPAAMALRRLAEQVIAWRDEKSE